MPGARLYVKEPLTALNFACPQGVIGGRSALRGAFPRGTLPRTQIPLKSCGSKACVVAFCAFGDPEDWAVWANAPDVNARIASTPANE